jgi:nitronate monooxygenase/enoyl-[acyl-carrier protein] reductase II
LRSPFIDEWQNRRDVAKQEAERLRGEVGAAVAQGRLGELFPFTGQTAGLITDVLPAAEIVHRLVAEAEETLQQTAHIASIR